MSVVLRHRYVLGPVQRVGGWRLAGLARQGLDAYLGVGTLAASGRKGPVAVLCDGPQGRIALGLDGAPLDAEALLPGVWAMFDADAPA